MRLCYGTFGKVIKLCALKEKTQLDVHFALLFCLDPSNNARLELKKIDGSNAHRWLNCEVNVNPNMIKEIKKRKPEEVAAEFKDTVIDTILDPNELEGAYLAIREIIHQDDKIKPETEVDLVRHVSKADLLLKEEPASIYPSFFAGVLLYAVSIVPNREGETCISEITSFFIGAVKVKPSDKHYILPIYLVLDSSSSMLEDDRFRLALNFVPKIFSAMIDSATLSEQVRVEIITFDEGARVNLPLGGLNELEEWLINNKKHPIIPDCPRTFYGKAFEKLKSEIQLCVRQIKNTERKIYRPVVFFITDGRPNDEWAERELAFTQLTSKNFEYRPNIVCVGVGEVQREDIAEYGAGRYQSPTGFYITKNEKLVIVPKDGVLTSHALKAIVPVLVASIVHSFNDISNVSGSDEVIDIFKL